MRYVKQDIWMAPFSGGAIPLHRGTPVEIVENISGSEYPKQAKVRMFDLDFYSDADKMEPFLTDDPNAQTS